MLARRQYRLAVLAALAPVCDLVKSPGNWPTPWEKLPALLVSTPTESKQSQGNNGPASFTTSASLVIQGQVSGKTPEETQDALDALCYAVENAVLKDYWVNAMIQQFSSVNTATEISSENSKHTGGFHMTIVGEMYEAFDPFIEPATSTPWPPAAPTTVPLDGQDIHLDLTNVADLTATYPNPPFPASVNPAPRVEGPDGRDEGALQIDLT